MNKTEATLRKAAELIQTHGWLQGDYGQSGRGFCLIGALQEAAHTHAGGYGSAREILRGVTGTTSVVEFNDRYCETQDDALALLEIAADLAA